MPSANQPAAPDRSRPEHSGRDLSLDERKNDVARLRDVAVQIRRQLARLDGVHDATQRETLKEMLEATAEQVEEAAGYSVETIQQAIYERTGDKQAKNSKDGFYKGGVTRK